MANQIGKIYVCAQCGAQVIVTKGGAGAIKCCASLREIGNAFQMYAMDSKGWYPPSQIQVQDPYKYNVDGTNYNDSQGYGAYWFTFLAKYVTKDLGKPWFLGNLRDARRLPTGLLPAGKENDDRRSHLYNSITTDEVGGHA